MEAMAWLTAGSSRMESGTALAIREVREGPASEQVAVNRLRGFSAFVCCIFDAFSPYCADAMRILLDGFDVEKRLCGEKMMLSVQPKPKSSRRSQ